MIALQHVFAFLAVCVVKVALYSLLIRSGVVQIGWVGPRLWFVSILLTLGLMADHLAALPGWQVVGTTIVAGTFMFGDMGYRTYLDGGIVPAGLLPDEWIAIWRLRWQAHQITIMIPEAQWADVRREVLAISWTHQPSLILARRELVRELARIKAAESNAPPASVLVEKTLKARAESDRKQVEALLEANQDRQAEIGSLFACLPTELFLARRDASDVTEVLARCKTVTDAVENNRKLRSELDKRPPQIPVREGPSDDRA